VIDGPIVGTPAEILARWGHREPRVFAGDGALEYVTLIEQMFPESTVFTELPPLAPSIARLAEEALRKGAPAAPDSIRPIYIRRSDAELARERLKI
jgi:tRNA A37 threonylcarbamoyladenosine modification protein TsaB